jgi:glycosyltransferase involved in cell wall biosynthesis
LQRRSTLHVTAHNGASILGGGEIWTALLLAGLQRRGHRVEMLCRDAGMAARIREFGVPAEVQHVGGSVAAHDALRLARRLRRSRPDALLLTSFKKLVLAGMGARLAGVPFVVQRIVLSTDHGGRGAQYRFALRNLVDAVVLNAESMRPAFLGHAPGLDASRLLTIHDGVTRPPLQRPPGSLRAELGIPATAQVVGSVTRLAEQKRLDRLLDAVTSLPGVHCLLAGEGPLEAELRARADRLGIAGRTHFTGFRRDIGDVLAALDVFVICSSKEGMANAMLEAMAAGVPVVSTPVSGAAEALGVGVDAAGVIIDEQAAGLPSVLKRLLDDAAARDSLGRRAASRASAEFGFDGMLDRWEALLSAGQSVPAPRPPSPSP